MVVVYFAVAAFATPIRDKINNELKVVNRPKHVRQFGAACVAADSCKPGTVSETVGECSPGYLCVATPGAETKGRCFLIATLAFCAGEA